MNFSYILFKKYGISRERFLFLQLLMSDVILSAVPNSQLSLISCHLVSFIAVSSDTSSRGTDVFSCGFFFVTTVRLGPRFVPFHAAWLWEYILHLTFSLLLLVLKKFHWSSIYMTVFITLEMHQSLWLSALCASPTALVWHSVCLSGKCQLGARFSCYSAVYIIVITHCSHLFLFYIDL